MRILHLGKYYPPYKGGMENFLRDLLKAQARQGISVMGLVHHHLRGCGVSREMDGNIGITRVPSWGQWLYLPVSPGFPRHLAHILRSFRPHILHLHVPNPSTCWCLLMPAARAVPWIVQWQSDVVPSAIDRRLKAAYRVYRPAEQALLRKAKRIIVASDPYLEQSEPLRKWVHKCRVIPLGIDPVRLDRPDASLLQTARESWKPGMLKVLAVGRLTYYKGFDVLIRAAEQAPFTVVQIVGEGALRRDLQKEIQTMGVGGRVLLRGGLPDRELQALMATCDLLCLPSVERTEAFGVVLLEAMRYAKPLVVSDIPGSGVGWVVRQGSCGLLAPPGDARTLAACFKRLFSQPTLREGMGIKGKEALHLIFHIQSVAERLLCEYQEVTGWRHGDCAMPTDLSLP